MRIPTCNVQNKHVTQYQHQLISKGDNGKSYLSFNRGEDLLEINCCLWRPCLLTDQDNMSNLYRASFSSFGQAVSEEKIFLNRPIRNKDCLWWPCLLMGRDKMCNFQRGPSIYASYQVSVHLSERFQRRRLKCEKLTDDSDGKSSLCLWQGELKTDIVNTIAIKNNTNVLPSVTFVVSDTKTFSTFAVIFCRLHDFFVRYTRQIRRS